MATEIGTLIAKFVADTTNFDKGIKKVEGGMRGTAEQAQMLGNAFNNALSRVSPTLGQLSTSLSGLTASFGAVGIAAGAAAAAFGLASAGIWQLANAAAEAGGKLKDLSNQTNFSVQTLSALKALARTSGTDIDSLSASLVILQKNLDKASEGDEKLQKTFKELGVTSTHNETALRQLFIGLSKVTDGTKQTALAAEALGRSGKAMLGVIKEGGGDLDESMAKLRKWGLIVTDEDAVAADMFSDHLDTLSARLSGIARLIGAETIPAFNAFFESIEASLDANETDWRSWGQTVAYAILSAESLLGGFANVVRNFDWTNLIPGYGMGKVGYEFYQGGAATAADIVPRYNAMVNPQVGGAVAFGGMAAFKGRGTAGTKNTGGGGGRIPKADPGQELLEQLKLQQAQATMSDYQILQEKLKGKEYKNTTDEVKKQILLTQQEIDIQKMILGITRERLSVLKDITDLGGGSMYFPGLLDERQRRVGDITEKQTDLGGGSEYLPGLGDTRSRRVSDQTRGRVVTEAGEARRRQYAEHVEQMNRLAYELTSTIDRAIYDGFEGGIKKGMASLALSILDMIRNTFLTALQNSIANALTNVTTGGGKQRGGILGDIGMFLIKVLGGAVGGGASAGKVGATAFSGMAAGAMAAGGPVSAGTPYIVGERGPELFMPNSSGNIIPNGGGNTVININVPVRSAGTYSTPKSRRQLAEDIAGALAGATS